MNFSDLINQNISKKMAMAIAAAYFTKDMTDWKMAALVIGISGLAIICQTVIDVKKRK